MNSRNCLVFIFGFFTCFLNAQEKDSTQSVIKVYQPSEYDSKNYNPDTYKWTVKTDLAAYTVGEFPIVFEYKIHEKFSVEASAGITYPFWGEILSDEDSFSETEPELGSVFRAGVKYFPSNDYDAIEGWGFGFHLFTKQNNYNYINDEYSGSDNFTNLDSEPTKKVNRTGINMTISKQIFRDSNISLEYMFGVGIVKLKKEVVGFDSISDQLVNSTDEKTVPNLFLGFRIGFGN